MLNMSRLLFSVKYLSQLLNIYSVTGGKFFKKQLSSVIILFLHKSGQKLRNIAQKLYKSCIRTDSRN